MSQLVFHLPETGPMLGGAGQRSDSPQSPTDAHRSSAGCMLEWRRFSGYLKTCDWNFSMAYRVTPVSLTRMEAKFSLHPVIKQPRCGILTATKRCRLHRFGWEAAAQLWSEKGADSSHTFHHISLQHDGPIKAIHWIKAPNYSCVMTGSWDKTLKVGT